VIDAGLRSDDAARATYLLIVYVFGSIALEVADEQEAGPLPPEAERIARRRTGFEAIPAGAYPLSAAAAPVMVATSPALARPVWP
jgi:TetR/AcrR family tetracycline transcriptional repressor